MIDTLSSNLMLICIVAFFTGLLWRAICPPCFYSKFCCAKCEGLAFILYILIYLKSPSLSITSDKKIQCSWLKCIPLSASKFDILICLVIMVRGRDACWEHCVLVDATRQKVRCNYCHREFSGGVYRMKFHLAQIKNKDIVPCAEVPDDVRDHIRGILSTPKKQKTPKKL